MSPVGEVITLVNIALGNAPIGACMAGDTDGDAAITIGEIIAAINNALCGGGPDRVNACWQGARCGLETLSRTQKLCAGYNPYGSGSSAVRCCGCVGDLPCPASAPACVAGTCM